MTQYSIKSALCALLFLSLGTSFVAQDEAPAKPTAGASVDVVMLANEGFLLRSENAAVLIDAFVAEPYSGYAHLEGETLEALVTAREPFDRITLALVSHHHRDHFQPDPAQHFLSASPDTVFATSPQVLETFGVGDSQDTETIRTKFPAPGDVESLVLEGVEVDFLHLSHGPGRFKEIENLGHVISMGGVTILHIGDAEISDRNFAPYELASRGIDVALIPYWYFGSEAGLALLAKHVPDAHLIACHIPGSQLASIQAQLARERPDVLVLSDVLETRTFKAREQ